MIDFRDKNKILSMAARAFPKVSIAGGVHPVTRRYGLFVYDALEPMSNLPAMRAREILFVEVAGSSEKDIEVVMAKLALVLG